MVGKDEERGFSVPQRKYYLVDLGYVNIDRFIMHFKGYRYYLSDYCGGIT